jgi:hypothetical protein
MTNAAIFKKCRQYFPSWQGLSIDDFTFDPPKGFSSFTMGIRANQPSIRPLFSIAAWRAKKTPSLILRRKKRFFLPLGSTTSPRIVTSTSGNFGWRLFITAVPCKQQNCSNRKSCRKSRVELYRFHQLSPPELPQTLFWDLLFAKWGALAQVVLEEQLAAFPANEQEMGEALREITHPDTLALVKKCLPDGELSFCHNDTYHGNIMRLENGAIKLLDFEFSCINYKAYDFSNLFAETVMQHQQAEYPYFRIGEPQFGDHELGMLINFYLDQAPPTAAAEREKTFAQLLADTKRMLIFSDFKYALAAIPLAVEPIQKIRFIPYAYQRFLKFKRAAEALAASKTSTEK